MGSDVKTHGPIQHDREEMTLETGKYPEIAFRSNHVEKAGQAQFKTDGALTLQGVSKPVRLGGGMIRIKDAVDIDFRIFARAG